METQPIIDLDREATPDAMNVLMDGVTDSIDHVVGDAVAAGTAYTGLTATFVPGTLTINVTPGRLYAGSKVYASDTALQIDVSRNLAGALQRICLITAYGTESDTDPAPVAFLVEAESTPTNPVWKAQQVPQNHRRLATVGPVYGQEAGNPVWPPYGLALPVAVAVLGPTGIVSCTNIPGNLLPNLTDVAARTAALEAFEALAAPEIANLTSSLAALRAAVDSRPAGALPLALAADVANLKLAANLPQNYSNYRADDFFDATYSATTAAGYHATTEEGLRFPPANFNDTQMSLNNGFDPLVNYQLANSSGLLLPVYTENVQRIVAGGVQDVALSQFAYGNVNTQLLSMSRGRVRYGAQFEESTGSAFYTSGQYIGGTSASSGYGAASVFLLNGETFQVTDTGTTDSSGHEIERFQQYWTDYSGSAYWSVDQVSSTTAGFCWAETFVQQGDKWVSAIGPRPSVLPASGTVTVGICGTANGYPDLTQVYAQQTVQVSSLTAQGGLGVNKVPITPVLLSGGQRYAYFVVTAAAVRHQTVATGTSPTTGAVFYQINGGVWNTDPSQHLMFDLWYLAFPSTSVQVELQGVNLQGGIAALDIISAQAVPDSCSISFAVFVNNAWQELNANNVNLLSSLPVYVQLAVRLSGTQDVMPGLNLKTNRVRAMRPDVALKHLSLPEVLAVPSKQISVKSTLENFDDNHHNYNSRLTPAGASASGLPATTVDVVRNGTTYRTETYTYQTAITGYTREIDGTTDSATNLFVATNCTEVAA